MLCDECKKRTACMHITKIANNQTVEKHLCEQCAKEHGEMNLTIDANFSVHDFLKGIFNKGFTEGANWQNTSACPQCGLTYSDFSRNGKIGCGECYKAFGDRLVPLLRRIHGTSGHTGKVPKRGGGKLVIKQQLKQKRKDLEAHVANEEYEQAARLRDEIRAMEKEMKGEE